MTGRASLLLAAVYAAHAAELADEAGYPDTAHDLTNVSARLLALAEAHAAYNDRAPATAHLDPPDPEHP